MKPVSLSRRTLIAFCLGMAVAASAAILLQPSRVEAQVGANQPYMQSALNSLLSAKSSLQKGATNKGGHRVNAIDLINQAIVEVQAGMAVAN
ncbi:twin-arginine translocation signal domain-containing protein [Terrarubrum flagellatum]|uniref:twin-arginine translocation signal domain-containing protein n=1 Tax=Terrirubrum flagellatum TaxID=2895980 RepID=UPI003145631C